MKETSLSRTIRLLCAGGMAFGLGLAGHPARADDAAGVQRVEITGSSIKRIAQEGALPVQTLTSADIARSGAKTVEDLIQALPAMQGFTASSESVNGSGGGVQNASLHGIGASYTLVLLNGRRLASYGSGSAVNLASIPLSAVERVEILTDGASTLYGSDAIAGVVNFILRRNQTDLAVEATANVPGSPGGRSANFSVSKGFGDLDKDRFNVLLSYSHDAQQELNASQRHFADTGLRRFAEGGKWYSMYQLAGNTTPASVTLNLKNGDAFTFSPSYAKTGQCAPSTAFIGSATDKSCWFDYASTVQLIPKGERDSVFASGTFRLDDRTSLFAEAVASRYVMSARYAPPAQAINLDLDDPKYAANVLPHLGKYGIDPASVDEATMNVRLVDAGGRVDKYASDARHLAFGIDGAFAGIDYTATYTHSESRLAYDFDGGYLSKKRYRGIVAAGSFDPFAPAGASASVLAPAVLHERASDTTSKLDVLSVHGAREVFTAPGGMAQLGAGIDLTHQTYAYDPAPIKQGRNPQQPAWDDAPLGTGDGAMPVAAARRNWGSFAELLVPVARNLEVTGALRYDSYTAVDNDKVYDANRKLLGTATQGNSMSKTTYKLSARLQAADGLLFRGSYGTGFKAPSLEDIAGPLSSGGFSNGMYPCPVKAPDPRAAKCMGNAATYQLLSGGNPLTGESGLKPEESKQYTFGMRVEPATWASLGLDLWSVRMRNQIVDLPETQAFQQPERYQDLFQVRYDSGRGKDALYAFLPRFNMGNSVYRGIDWDGSVQLPTGLGPLALRWTGTYMLEASFDLPGSGYESSVGRFDSYQNVTARILTRIAATLRTGKEFSHVLALNYRSGYHDQVLTPDDYKLREVKADGTLGEYVGIARDVRPYYTVDWQTRFDMNKDLAFTAGIRNLFNADPSFSNRISGGGNQASYDGRYNSPLGRQFYLTANARF